MRGSNWRGHKKSILTLSESLDEREKIEVAEALLHSAMRGERMDNPVLQQELDQQQDFTRRKVALNELIKKAKSERKFAHRPGDTMPNGGVILQQWLLKNMNPGMLGDEHLVLALIPGGVPHSFVVWHRCVGTGQRATGGYDLQDYCFGGHYCKTISDALTTFEQIWDERTIEGDA